MNYGEHAKLGRWGMSFVELPIQADILDLGCGGGGNLERWLERYPDAHVSGIDHSPVSVSIATGWNEKAISQDRCEVILSGVNNLPFRDESFDAISSFESIYFWSNMEKALAEAYRVLKPGGVILLVVARDKENKCCSLLQKIHGARLYDEKEMKTYLENAGFLNFRYIRAKKRPWRIALCRKGIPVEL
jgi:methyltransferase